MADRERMAFDLLNDDCLLDVIKRLEFPDQLSLLSLTPALTENVRYEWRNYTKYVLDAPELIKLQRNPEHLLQLSEIINSTVQELVIDYGKVEHLQPWKKHSFSSIRTLKCSLDDEVDPAEGIRLLVELFPALTSLKLEGPISGIDMWHWTELQDLDLSGCYDLEPQYFKQIFGTLKLEKLNFAVGQRQSYLEEALSIASCRTLQELQIDDFYVTEVFIAHLNMLPNFRRLTMRTTGNPKIEAIVNLMSYRITQAQFNDAIWTCPAHVLQKLTSLELLAIIEDDIESSDITLLVSNLPSLKQLHLINTQIWRVAADLWNMVNLCPSLELINLTGMQMYEDFFDVIGEKMELSLRNREKPLIVNLHNTGDQEHLIIKYFKHPNLKISFEPLEMDFIEASFIQLDFNSK
ncbi:uncharacterized protein LOC115625691 [Scaptodrosophila lebanonensis]|uniref:Uncharacterized protein LOC115625691 n=1 Tax=Drosophila lebanonensis TaxID=7225 RepID=A0A6J2TNZ1_DROLE|nr:uncharacterized protein LOC115625691 [Scaptodrosophila lebanonensis]